MSSAILIGQWSSGIWETLGSPTSLSALTISGYATQVSTLGRLNSFIGMCYSGSGYAGTGTFNNDVVPDFTNTELAIIEQMYLGSYYSNLATATMGMDALSLPWTSLREGDSSIQRINGATVGKEYREMAKDANARLNYLVNSYLVNSQGAGMARQVSYLNPPLPGYAGDGYGPIP